MTRPVRTRAICRGRTITSCAAARSKPADSPVPYAGRAIVGSSRRIRSRMASAYRGGAIADRRRVLVARLLAATLLLLVLTPAGEAQNRNAPLPLAPSIRTGTL